MNLRNIEVKEVGDIQKIKLKMEDLIEDIFDVLENAWGVAILLLTTLLVGDLTKVIFTTHLKHLL